MRSPAGPNSSEGNYVGETPTLAGVGVRQSTSVRALNFRTCDHCGPHTLHRDTLCVSCNPAQPKPPVVKPTLTLPKRPPRVGRPAGELNAREIEVVMEVARGQMQKDIAYRLGISRSAVANILRRAMTRVGIKSRWEMYRYVRARAEVGA